MMLTKTPLVSSFNKIFVLDTNVLLFDPQAIFRLGAHEIVIPLVVIEEIDRFKREMSENGRHARLLSRLIDEMRSEGELSLGVRLKSGGLLKIVLSQETNLPYGFDVDSVDNHILGLAYQLQKKWLDKEIICLTKDTNLRIKADTIGVRAQDYEPIEVSEDQLYQGTAYLTASVDWIAEFKRSKKAPAASVLLGLSAGLFPNQYCVISSEDPSASSPFVYARYYRDTDMLVSLRAPIEGLWGISARNAEQFFAIDALIDDSVKLVSLIGKAGTGKTLLAIAAGLIKTIDEGRYHRLLVSRPIFPLGKDIGFLPGNIEEKLNPWMQPIYDNIDFLFGQTRNASETRSAGRGCQELINQGLLQIEPLTYIRGRSIPKQFLIVDESQNLSPHEIKTIVTRAGEETKIVLTGDSYQIDNPYVDSLNNGLVYLVERFKDQKIAAHITLTTGERSELSELATQLL